MTIHLENEVVGSAFDPITQIHTYTVARDGKRWTVTIPNADFERFGPRLGARAAINQLTRRKHLAMRLTAAMDGPPDD